MDVEDLARFLLNKGFSEDEVKALITFLATFRKGLDFQRSSRIADGVIRDVETSSRVLGPYKPREFGVRVGEAGVGSRGTGDLAIHSVLLKLTKSGDAFKKGNLVAAVDGFHSRLNPVPLLMGFHATRAALRDVMVAGGEPLLTLIDVHLADDTDLAYLIDVSVGAKVASDACGAEFGGGSTLRIGGDMVWGSRVTGGSFALGRLVRDLNRFNARPGLKLCSTIGKGGGTVTAIALYHGIEELVELTLNVDFCYQMRRFVRDENVKAAFDWTNGGILLDAFEISEELGVKVSLNKKVYDAVHPKLRKALEELDLDPLSTSVDAIVLIAEKCPEDTIEIGTIEEGRGVYLEGKELEPSFREAPYTHLKKAVESISKRIDINDLVNYEMERLEFLKNKVRSSY
ncbi:hypothetical protein EYM_06300 [Ignicoccus islandicus DSM 13165]|uniref:Uncharacterized protein n=1 Tax=Ignicoccus islandicus DSM 13165 TaxID=940295 RepID=A0A0U2VFA6_9CREN|nr:AIR synthase related protein [Ignicoccus islandicus]ALU12674.1 hypothetical protein EYM_06300 [Ignicoccus islandicus DSM 13165]